MVTTARNLAHEEVPPRATTWSTYRSRAGTDGISWHSRRFPLRQATSSRVLPNDLRTFKTDLGTTLRMAELVEDRNVLVSESGINTYADIKKLAGAGVRAVLVGESLMRSPDIGAKVRELFNP